MADGQPVPILLFADSVLGIRPYVWQCNILLNYEGGYQTAPACANFTGKTSTVFPIAALWTLYNFPRARLMYLSATGHQVKQQFFSSLSPNNVQPSPAGPDSKQSSVRLRVVSFLAGLRIPVGTSKDYTINPTAQPDCW
jgi:hypothetical protein